MQILYIKHIGGKMANILFYKKYKSKVYLALNIIIIPLLITACSLKENLINRTGNVNEKTAGTEKTELNAAGEKGNLINKDGSTIQERFKTPEGFERIKTEEGSFGEYLRNLPLKPHGSKVHYYNGGIKAGNVYEAVIDIDIGTRDLQQCADAVMRLRAEYLYKKGLYNSIHFNFVNGFKADFVTWSQGNRIRVEGNNAYWVPQAAEPSNDYETFRKYLDMVFAYANTLSLSQEMKKVPVTDMNIGDVFIKGEEPGHCVIVVDMAENKNTGEKKFIIAQSYMPAQDIHILKNPQNGDGNPWYPLDFGEKLITPEWIFNKDQLMRFE